MSHSAPAHLAIDRRSLLLGALATPWAAAAAHAEKISRAPLPDGRVARGTGDIREATLIGATKRYEHFVLGSRHEAAGLRVTTANGTSAELLLPPDSVFEDRETRIVDLDGDGTSEVVTVRSRQSTGSALAILGLRDGQLKILAETPPNGGPQRWLNPAGVGRFAGTDRRQIAIVRMPHVVGRLEFWQYDRGTLVLTSSFEGASNHRIGSSHLHMSAVIPASDGKTDLLAVPSLDRRTVLLIDARSEAAKAVGRLALPAPADGNFTLSGVGAGAELAVPLANGVVRRVAVSDIMASN